MFHLEVVRKVSRFVPAGTGKPPAEGAVAFSTGPWGGVGHMP